MCAAKRSFDVAFSTDIQQSFSVRVFFSCMATRSRVGASSNLMDVGAGSSSKGSNGDTPSSASVLLRDGVVYNGHWSLVGSRNGRLLYFACYGLHVFKCITGGKEIMLHFDGAPLRGGTCVRCSVWLTKDDTSLHFKGNEEFGESFMVPLASFT